MSRVFTWVFVALLLFITPQTSFAATQESCKFTQKTAIGGFGRITGKTDLLKEPESKTEIEKLLEGREIQVLEGPLCKGTQVWAGVKMLDSKKLGWLKESSFQFADPNSTTELRVYGNEWCVATPLSSEAVPQPGFSLPKHILTFDPLVTVDGVIFTLLFNGKPLETGQFEVEEAEPLEISLADFWTLRHSAFDPIWSDVGFWQLSYHCPAKILPTFTPTPTKTS